MNQTEYLLINTQGLLNDILPTLASTNQLAVDLEYDDMHYYYGRQLGLVQLYNQQQVYLVDPLGIDDLTGLWQILENPNILKVFHSCRNDLLILNELYGLKTYPIDDTAIMAHLSGLFDNPPSLKRLVKEVLDIDLSKGPQRSNWLARPLTQNQLNYAALDVLYLFTLRDYLLPKVQANQATEALLNQHHELKQVQYSPPTKPWLRLQKKYNVPNDRVKLLRFLFKYRDSVARAKNKPTYKIISNKQLAQLCTGREGIIKKIQAQTRQKMPAGTQKKLTELLKGLS